MSSMEAFAGINPLTQFFHDLFIWSNCNIVNNSYEVGLQVIHCSWLIWTRDLTWHRKQISGGGVKWPDRSISSSNSITEKKCLQPAILIHCCMFISVGKERVWNKLNWFWNTKSMYYCTTWHMWSSIQIKCLLCILMGSSSLLIMSGAVRHILRNNHGIAIVGILNEIEVFEFHTIFFYVSLIFWYIPK